MYIMTTKYHKNSSQTAPQGKASQGKCVHNNNKILDKTHYRQPLKGKPHKAFVYIINIKAHHRQPVKGTPHEAFVYIMTTKYHKNSSQTAPQGKASQGKCVHNNNKILHKTHHRQPLKGKPHKAFVYIITTKYHIKTHHRQPLKGKPHKAFVYIITTKYCTKLITDSPSRESLTRQMCT